MIIRSGLLFWATVCTVIGQVRSVLRPRMN